ncbi:MAG: NADH-quinone oxidoreductase subunit L, partial [Gemmatimonadetes bacterium]|nr:NADH-quinone oxidoreductase subunit L [Gemmatimonadota bacterium]
MTGAPLVAQETASFHPVLPFLILLFPLLGASINGVGAFLWRGDKMVPAVIGPGALIASFIVVVLNFLGMRGVELHGAEISTLWTWIESGDLRIGVDLQFDQLSMLMCLIITGVGSLIHIYSVGYMRDDPGFSRYFCYLNLFVFFMLILVLGASLPLMFVGWEGVGLCSYLLIGFWYDNKEYANAGKKAFIVNRIGDAGFLIAMFMIFVAFGTLDFVPIVESAPDVLSHGGLLVTGITLLLFLGCTGKSAQIPLYTWLPDAMAGPTPVSALIHAATMVTAGVYLIARLSVLFALAPFTQGVVAAVGAGTALFAATIAIQQYDIKKVLAYSTISQLGYMFLAVGVGALTAGVFHLMTHAFFKALLFLGAGAVIHAVHHAWDHAGGDGHDHHHGDPNDMRNYGGLRAFMPKTWVFMWVATLAIAGVAPFAGFFSKDEIIWQTAAFGGAETAPYPLLYAVYWVIALAAAMLTAFYMTRMMVMTFHGENRTGTEEARHLHEAPAVMWVPLAVLAVLSVFGGWVNVPEALQAQWAGLWGVLPTSEWLHHWLEPVTEQAHHIQEVNLGEVAHSAPIVGGSEVVWAAVSTLAAAVVVFAALRVVGGRAHVAAKDDTEVPTGFAAVLANKYYVDEMYDRFIVQPVIRASRFCWRVIDAGVIDGTVNAVGWLAKGLGTVGGFFQTGTVNTYAFILTAGVLAIL